VYTDQWWLDVQILLCNLCFYDALSRMPCFWLSPDYQELQLLRQAHYWGLPTEEVRA
jgi:hypothetical protein